jgi:predicted site-specific integrase-resolvase
VRLLPPRDVRRLLGIGRTTLHDWTVAGRVACVTSPTGYRKYPADQPALQAAVAAQESAQ